MRTRIKIPINQQKIACGEVDADKNKDINCQRGWCDCQSVRGSASGVQGFDIHVCTFTTAKVPAVSEVYIMTFVFTATGISVVAF